MFFNQLTAERRHEIDQIARDVTERISTNPFVVASRLGISVCHKPYERWHALGLLRKSRAGFAIFLVSPLKPNVRRLVMAHLIGHWILHRSYYNSTATMDWIAFGGTLFPMHKGLALTYDNQEADAFAAGFLLAEAEQSRKRLTFRQLRHKTGLPAALIRAHLALYKQPARPLVQRKTVNER